MKYHSQLIEATLLKRPISFLVEAVLQSKRRIMLRCPNLGSLQGCDILGTQLWFSAPSQGHCLPTLELLEVNEGALVAINQENLKGLFLEALQQSKIKELPGYALVESENYQHIENLNMFLNLRNDRSKMCYVCLEQVIHMNEQGEGIFPINYQYIDTNLDYLLIRKKQGHRAILMFCILHNGIHSLRILDPKNCLYLDKVKHAIQQGVEILGYKAGISIDELKLLSPISIQLSQLA